MLGGKNSKNKYQLGYTIIEVMIVLAVSGVMFLIASNFISGKHERTAFTEGVNDTVSRLQDTIEQVTDGEYSDIQLNCQFSGSQTSFPSGVVKAQGANAPCVFLGKLWYFPAMTTPTSKTSAYQVLSLAGGRVDNSGAVITNPANAHPAAAPDLTTNQVISQNLDVSFISYCGSDGKCFKLTPPIQAFGFLQSQGSTDANGNLASGAQTVGLYYARGTVDAANLNNLTAVSSIAMCVTDEQRYALITVGINDVSGTVNGTGDQLSVDVTIQDPGAKDCVLA